MFLSCGVSVHVFVWDVAVSCRGGTKLTVCVLAWEDGTDVISLIRSWSFNSAEPLYTAVLWTIAWSYPLTHSQFWMAEIKGHVPCYKTEKMSLCKKEKSTVVISWSVFTLMFHPCSFLQTERNCQPVGSDCQWNRKWNWENQTDDTDDNEEIIICDGESNDVDYFIVK